MKKFLAILALILTVSAILILVSYSHFNSYSEEGNRNLARFRLPGTAVESINFIQFSYHDNINIHDTFQEFDIDEHDNSSLTIIARQWELLQQFIEGEPTVLTTRRGLIMHRDITPAALPSFYELYGVDWDCGALMALDLTLAIRPNCQNNLNNERLMNIFHEFHEICGGNIFIHAMGELFSEMLTTRHSLSQSQLKFLEALESYMEFVNIPFWYDMYKNDPVITHIGLPNPNTAGRCYFFTVWLYDPALIALSDDELAEYTIPLREEMKDFIGLQSYRFEFRVNRCTI